MKIKNPQIQTSWSGHKQIETPLDRVKIIVSQLVKICLILNILEIDLKLILFTYQKMNKNFYYET